MDPKITPKDKKILRYLAGLYTCPICKNILIECVTLSCGHHYCGHCLELLNAGNIGHCAQCSAPIRNAYLNKKVNDEICKFVNSCSISIQKEYASAIQSRFRKYFNEDIVNEHENIREDYQTSLIQNGARTQRDVCSRILRGSVHSKSRSQLMARSGPSTACKKSDFDTQSQVDIDKVNELFGIYDNVLNPEVSNETEKNMAGGDFAREDERNMEKKLAYETRLSNMAKQNELEIASLIKETEDIIRLDGHIQKWSSKMTEALTESESFGIKDECVDTEIHAVDDELWKASKELLRKLQGIQMQRKKSKNQLCLDSPLPPQERSSQINLEEISDDSDADDYEETLEHLQASLENSRAPGSSANCPEEKEKTHDSSLESKDNKINGETTEAPSKVGLQEAPLLSSREARRPTASLEGSGQAYLRENIDFVTKLRQYKEALVKIQNREAVTAEQIKDLVPCRSSTMDGTTLAPILKKPGNKVARVPVFNTNCRAINSSRSGRLLAPMNLEEISSITPTYEATSMKPQLKQNMTGRYKQSSKMPTCRNHTTFTSR